MHCILRFMYFLLYACVGLDDELTVEKCALLMSRCVDACTRLELV